MFSESGLEVPVKTNSWYVACHTLAESIL